MTSLDEKRNLKGPGGSEEIEHILRNTIVSGEISEFVVVAEGEERTTWFIWLLVCCCTISGLLFGRYFDTWFLLCA
jgi:SP family myo-inositol transporter-like MFS transporter 13